MKRKNVKITHWCDDMFTISCTCVYNVEKQVPYYTRWGDCVMGGSGEYEEVEDENEAKFYYTSMRTLYVDILTAINKTFGTDYKITEEDVKRADYYRNKLQCSKNIGIEVGWELSDIMGGSYELIHKYKYINTPELGICKSGWYDWNKDALIELADALVKWNESDPYAITKRALEKRYEMYDRVGVIYEKDENYSK